MEYFDFDGASYGSHTREDDVASYNIEIDECDAVANCDLGFSEEQLDFSNELQEQDVSEQQMEAPFDPATLAGAYPNVRAKEPCDFCRHMNLDCFVAKRGVMENCGCTCCISLYRKCSFTHVRQPGKFLDTLHSINENVDIPTGGPTGKKVLKSLIGITVSEDADGRARKSSSRLSREAVRILKNWLLEHREHPYPNEEEKDKLKQRTGLTRSQISNWLANARRRGKVRASPLGTSPVSGAIDIPGKQQHPDVALMTPLERWKYSPPENEPASTSDILRALVNAPLDPRRRSSQSGHVSSLSRKTGSSNDDSSHANSNIFQAPSVSSLETSRSATRSSISDLSFASAFSHRSSLESFGSMERKERRRRRKPSTTVNTFNQQKARNTRIYQCTFCTDSFATKYDWQRHEKSLHLALEKWTCSPQGGIVSISGINCCVFCMTPNPDNDHLESHNYSSCLEKTLAERTFYRKDHLNQHLRLMHNVKFDPSMDKWRSSTTQIQSRCGFCGLPMMTWKDRVDHLAGHFKNGADMAQWQGDWGFEPLIQGLVENAMPPYLIGQERKTLDPYKTSHTVGQSAFSSRNSLLSLNEPEDASCFHRLQRELTIFIRNKVAEGIVPTDQMIQDQGRIIIYGSDDPWNQTCADNPVWLSILKRDMGLEVVPDSEHIQLDNLDMQPPFAVNGGLRQPPIENNISARTVCQRLPLSSSNFSPGYQYPSFPGTGRSSAAASVPESLAASYVGSTSIALSGANSGLSTDFGSNLSAGLSSFSTPMSGSVDPFVQMGFEPEFLQRLNDRYGEMHLDNMEGLMLAEDDERDGGFIPESDVDQLLNSTGDPLLVTHAGSAPITIPSPKHAGIPITDDTVNKGKAPLNSLYYPGVSDTLDRYDDMAG